MEIKLIVSSFLFYQIDQRINLVQLRNLAYAIIFFYVAVQFTDSHIASNMMIFYLAGHLSSSLPIAFAFYELAMHPELQEKLRKETNKARDANDGVLDYDTLKRIAYLDMVISGRYLDNILNDRKILNN